VSSFGDTFRPASEAKLGGIMNTGSSISLNSRAWRDLYKAALFEVDKTRLPDRIARAEEALVVRARELFHVAGDNIEEEQALDDTMYALHMLCETHRKLAAALPHRCEAA
jgi:hypothetical protein